MYQLQYPEVLMFIQSIWYNNSFQIRIPSRLDSSNILWNIHARTFKSSITMPHKSLFCFLIAHERIITKVATLTYAPMVTQVVAWLSSLTETLKKVAQYKKGHLIYLQVVKILANIHPVLFHAYYKDKNKF